MEADPIKPADAVDAGNDDADKLDSPGNEMTRKLNQPDRAAVDMLFDRITRAASATGNGGDGLVAMTNAVGNANLQAVEKLLNLLSIHPAAEPPADLSTRTLQRIAHATGSALPTAPGAFINNPDQPLA